MCLNELISFYLKHLLSCLIFLLENQLQLLSPGALNILKDEFVAFENERNWGFVLVFLPTFFSCLCCFWTTDFWTLRMNKMTWSDWFLNISMTPLAKSLACSTSLALMAVFGEMNEGLFDCQIFQHWHVSLWQQILNSKSRT